MKDNVGERLTKSGDGVGLVNQKCRGALGIEIQRL